MFGMFNIKHIVKFLGGFIQYIASELPINTYIEKILFSIGRVIVNKGRSFFKYISLNSDKTTSEFSLLYFIYI
jgi:hypothetical protein